MGYTLQALICDASTLKGSVPASALAVSLPQGKALIPLSEGIREFFEFPFLPLMEEGIDEIPTELDDFREFLTVGKVAYVEAQFFGGIGTQASAIWENGVLIFGPIVDVHAINKALQLLGIAKGNQFDEFAALELGRNRDTEDWVA